jgi:hypothetical protein
MTPSYCPDHDPLLRAGFVTCDSCGRVAFPTDAAWLDADGPLVIAAFPRLCQHYPRSEVRVIDVEKLPVVDFDAARYDPGRRCAGRTRAGARCRAHARPGSDFCAQHDRADR